MSKFTKAVESSRLPPGASLCVDVEGEKVALFNVDGNIHAIADTCTHRGGPLSEGEVEGTEVTCPWHGATFVGRRLRIGLRRRQVLRAAAPELAIG